MRWLVVLTLLLPRVALAEDDLVKAERFLEEMEYRRALKMADKLLAAGGRGPTELVQAYRIRGLCLAGLGKAEESMQAFRRLLAIDPGFRLSTDVSPRLAGGFYQAVAYAKNQKPITLVHRPPETGVGEPLAAVSVSLQADPLGMVKLIRLVYAPDGGADQVSEQTVAGLGEVSLRLLEGPTGSGQVAYFIEALDEKGSVLKRVGSLEDRLRWQRAKPEATPVVARQDLSPPAPAAPPVEQEEPGQDEEETVWYKTPWFWATVGLVVAGAAAGTAVALTADDGPKGPVDYAIEIR